MTIRSAIRRVPLLVAAVIAATLLPVGSASAGGGCTITGTQGDDRLIGTNGSDVICGLGGDDRIRARGGGDVIRGGPGSDDLFGNAGADAMVGGAGSDFMIPGRGRDLSRGGLGQDFSGVQSADNDTNPAKDLMNIKVLSWEYLTDADAWGLIAKKTSSHGLVQVNRIKPRLNPMGVDWRTGNRIVTIRLRQVWDAFDWRNTAGTPGA